MLVENCKLSRQKDVVSGFSIHFGLNTDPLNRFIWPGNTPISARNKVNSIIKMVTFHPEYNKEKNKKQSKFYYQNGCFSPKIQERKKLKLKVNFHSALCLQRP